MSINQISVFLENKEGRLHRLTNVLGSAGIDLLAAGISETRDFGIFRAVTSDNAKAEKVLCEAGYAVGKSEVIGILLPNKPNAVTTILKIMYDNQINVEYMYSYSRGEAKEAVMLLRVPYIQNAEKILRENGMEIISKI